MVRDGWISCSLDRYEQVVTVFNKHLKSGKTRGQAILDTVDETNVSQRHVYRILDRLG
jgi:hypothetical protein